MTKELDANQIMAQSSLIYSAQQIDEQVRRVAAEMNTRLQKSPVVMICVMSGGLYFSGQLLAKLSIQLELDYVQANRYQKALSGGELNWTRLPAIDLKDKTVLIVDDILDEGLTLHAVYQQCQTLGAKQILTAVLADKSNGLDKPIQADFTCVKVPDQFVFGCGMDAYGWWRNLAEIRALT